MSTIDKFGRLLQSGNHRGDVEPGPRGPPGLLPTDKDGNYNVQGKRLKTLHDPEDKQDAATRQWVEKHFLSTAQKNFVSLGNRRLTDLGAPTQPNDAATKAYVDSKFPDYESLGQVILIQDKVTGIRTPISLEAVAAALVSGASTNKAPVPTSVQSKKSSR